MTVETANVTLDEASAPQFLDVAPPIRELSFHRRHSTIKTGDRANDANAP